MGNQPVERLAFDELHRQEMEPGCLLDRVDRDDMRVVESGDGPSLALEAPEAVWITGHLGWQHLQRHVSAQLHVGRAIHLAHAAGAEQ